MTDSPILEWINKAEEHGIFVSRTSFVNPKLILDSEELQGFAIADPFGPFVFVNSKDWNAAQLFTLVHELAHIWIAESGISNEVEIDAKSRDKVHEVELFCNSVAGSALMPHIMIKDIGNNQIKSSKELFTLSRKLGVSTFALLVRALKLNLISHEVYKKLKQEADREFHTFLRKKEEKKLLQKEQEKAGGLASIYCS